MCFEEFSQRNRFTTRSTVVTGTDMDIFAALTGATNPLFLSEEFGRKQGFEERNCTRCTNPGTGRWGAALDGNV
jgi:acyl dehydratase